MDLVLREYKSCAGDTLQSNNGVFLYSKSAMYVSNFFAIPTDFSARSLHIGCKGLLVMCSNPHSFAKSQRSSDENWGLLSVTQISTKPLRDKCTLSI